AVNFNARTQHLAAFPDHFLALSRVIDDVSVFVGQVVFFEHGAHTVAPAAGRLQISDDFGFFHNFTIIGLPMPIYCHNKILSQPLSFGAVSKRLTAFLKQPTSVGSKSFAENWSGLTSAATMLTATIFRDGANGRGSSGPGRRRWCLQKEIP